MTNRYDRPVSKSGVYMICNKWNAKIYIGSSKNLKHRISAHKTLLKGNKHHNNRLQTDYNKMGSCSFEYKIIENCEQNIRFDREQYYLNTLLFANDLLNNSFYRLGYNNERFALPIFNRSKYKKIYSICPYTKKIIKEYYNTVEAAKDLNTSSEKIARAIRIKGVSCNFYWTSEKELKHFLDNLVCHKFIYQIDEDLKIINKFKMFKEIQDRLNIAPGNVKKCIKGKRNTAGGFYWTLNPDSFIKPCSKREGTKKGFKHKKILDLNTNLLYKSMSDYCNKNEINYSTFKAHINKNKKSSLTKNVKVL